MRCWWAECAARVEREGPGHHGPPAPGGCSSSTGPCQRGQASAQALAPLEEKRPVWGNWVIQQGLMRLRNCAWRSLCSAV